MPCWPLVITSIGFFIPALVAAKMKKHKEKNIIMSLASTSVLYHGTVHPLAQFIDTCVAHFTAIRFLTEGLRDFLNYKRMYDVIGITMSGISIFMYYTKSLRIDHEDTSRKWHMGVHITAQMALLIFLKNKNRHQHRIVYYRNNSLNLP
jgi:hypothetical protein